MHSVNFEFLRKHQRELADLGGFAEKYIHDDPEGALAKLRLFAETLTSSIFARRGFQRPDSNQFHDLLNDHQFVQAIPPVVRGKLDLLKRLGNAAVHGRRVSSGQAFTALQEAHQIATWFAISFLGLDRASCPAYRQPTHSEEAKAQLKREKKAALQEKEAAEAKMAKLLEELEAARAQAEATEKSKEELAAILAQTQQVANALDFDEATTRAKLIDQALVDAGWTDIPRSPQKTEDAWIETKLTHTDGSPGFADYVLWDDDGTPLAVIEAKKAAEDGQKGRIQAVKYADGLKQMYGKRPIAFCTNGYNWEIIDGERGDPPRAIWGMYSQRSLQHLRSIQRQPLSDLNPDFRIAGYKRHYQVEAIQAVSQRFDEGFRRALITQATGTGKTRVAIALTKNFLAAGWGKRVLFLCDRKELRKQAYNAFVDLLPGEPAVILNRSTVGDTQNRIFLATYPAMMKSHQQFDVGFFDIIIADESHRSIYNRYKALFDYFDAFQVGLTATPKGTISHNTYKMFGCQENDPTFAYSYQEAISEVPPVLCRYKVVEHTTQFLREGIYWENLDTKQRKQLEQQIGEQFENGRAFRFDAKAVDKAVFNKDTNREILRNLMENGQRNAANTHIGKSIIFARNHDHAVLLGRLFEEMYPKLAGAGFHAVIDNHEPRASQLIDDFKTTEAEAKRPLMLAISVDMLDTGVDVPEVVNLVFAKPVQSEVKFWQMVGRGTRLCPDLFRTKDSDPADDCDKHHFIVYDHWANFQRMEDGEFTEDESSLPKSAQQCRFEDRIALAEAAVAAQDLDAFRLAIDHLRADLNDLDDASIAVKEKWRERQALLSGQTLDHWKPDTVAMLKVDMAPLMMWRSTTGADAAERFDRLIAQCQAALLKDAASYDNLRDQIAEQAAQLNLTLTQVQDHLDLIHQVRDTGSAFWNGVTVAELERIREVLRGIMKHRNRDDGPTMPKPVIDITDGKVRVAERSSIYQASTIEYRQRAQGVLEAIFDECPALQKIKQRQPVTEAELQDLADRVAMRDAGFTVDDLLEHFPHDPNTIELAIRSVIGLDAEAVNAHFQSFIEANPKLNKYQHRFLALLKSHIVQYGAIEIERLYEVPFTNLSPEGVDGLFENEQVDALIDLIERLNAA